MNNYYKPGDWLAICDVCGFKYKASQLRKRWDGLRVCERDWEPRHELDMLRAPPAAPSIPWARPEPADTFVSVTYGNQGNQVTSVPAGTFTPDATQH